MLSPLYFSLLANSPRSFSRHSDISCAPASSKSSSTGMPVMILRRWNMWSSDFSATLKLPTSGMNALIIFVEVERAEVEYQWVQVVVDIWICAHEFLPLYLIYVHVMWLIPVICMKEVGFVEKHRQRYQLVVADKLICSYMRKDHKKIPRPTATVRSSPEASSVFSVNKRA